MKIIHVEPMLIALPYEHGAPKPTLGTGAVRTLMDGVYVRVDTDEGISGWGEAFGFAACPISLAALKLTVGPTAVGRDPRDIGALMADLNRRFQGMALNGPVRFALSALDIALWDIKGKVEGKPIWQLLGGDGRRSRIPTYASLIRTGANDLVKKLAAHAVGRGYRHIKLHERTVEAVAAARDAVGPDIALMFDTNCTWLADEAIPIARCLVPYDLFWFEEPISPPDDFKALAKLRRHGGVPVAAGENLGTLLDMERMLDAEAVDFVQPDVTKIGGITEMWKAAALADARGVKFEPHSPLYGPGLVATLHLLAALPTEAFCEFYYCDLGASPMGAAIEVVDGHMSVPQGPGLGVEIDLDVLDRHRIG